MTVPFYVSPEQLMKDRADYARKGIARGRSVVVLGYDGGVVFVAENPSRALHKVSEIYDRIGFAAVGKYNEFENLRVAGVRYADLRGYSYDRADVTARALANAYAQTLGTVFTQESKPYEVEIVVAEVGHTAATDQIYRLTYDGSVADEHGYVAMGGAAEPIVAELAQRWRPDLHLGEALRLAVDLLEGPPAVAASAQAGAGGADPAQTAGGGGTSASGEASTGGAARRLDPQQLEVAVLDRRRPRRTFRRIVGATLAALLDADDPLLDLPAGDLGDAAPRTTSGTPVPQDGEASTEETTTNNPQTQHPDRTGGNTP